MNLLFASEHERGHVMTIVNRMLFLAMSAFAALAWMPASAGDDGPQFTCPSIYGKWRMRYELNLKGWIGLVGRNVTDMPELIDTVDIHTDRMIVVRGDNTSYTLLRSPDDVRLDLGFMDVDGALFAYLIDRPDGNSPTDKCYLRVIELMHGYYFEKIE